MVAWQKARTGGGAPARPVLRYHGGKWRLAEWIIGFFPPHRVYVEPFGGTASVLLQRAAGRQQALDIMVAR